MTNVSLVGSAQGSARKIGTGFTQKVLMVLLGAALVVGLAAPRQAKADSAMTQLQYLQYMVQLAGDTSKFSQSSTPSDYVNWAKAQGMNPAGGWQPDAALSRDVLGQTLSQFYNLTQKAGADYAKLLLREGIQLPDAPTITRSAFVSIVDDFGFQSRGHDKKKTKKSKHKTPTKKKTKEPTVKKPSKKK